MNNFIFPDNQNKDIAYQDPEILSIACSVVGFSGLAEKIKRICRVEVHLTRSKNKSISKLIENISLEVAEARSSIRLIKSTIEDELDMPDATIALTVPQDEYRIYKPASEQLLQSIIKINNYSSELEVELKEYSQEKTRFFKLSQLSLPLTRSLQRYLDCVVEDFDCDEDEHHEVHHTIAPSLQSGLKSNEHHPVIEVFIEADRYLQICQNQLEKHQAWLRGDQDLI